MALGGHHAGRQTLVVTLVVRVSVVVMTTCVAARCPGSVTTVFCTMGRSGIKTLAGTGLLNETTSLGECTITLPPGEAGGGRDCTRKVVLGLPGVGVCGGYHGEAVPERIGMDTDETGVGPRFAL